MFNNNSMLTLTVCRIFQVIWVMLTKMLNNSAGEQTLEHQEMKKLG